MTEELLKHKCFKYFYEISQIPRKSFDEKRIADYIEAFAAAKGYKYSRDTLGNIIINRPASKGRENEPALILQAHTDMICDKTADSDHDFSTDPIEWVVDGEWLRAKDTTLGADDGAGAAYILSV